MRYCLLDYWIQFSLYWSCASFIKFIQLFSKKKWWTVPPRAVVRIKIFSKDFILPSCRWHQIWNHNHQLMHSNSNFGSEIEWTYSLTASFCWHWHLHYFKSSKSHLSHWFQAKGAIKEQSWQHKWVHVTWVVIHQRYQGIPHWILSQTLTSETRS